MQLPGSPASADSRAQKLLLEPFRQLELKSVEADAVCTKGLRRSMMILMQPTSAVRRRLYEAMFFVSNIRKGGSKNGEFEVGAYHVPAC